MERLGDGDPTEPQRSDVNGISGDCGRAEAIHGMDEGRRRAGRGGGGGKLDLVAGGRRSEDPGGFSEGTKETRRRKAEGARSRSASVRPPPAGAAVHGRLSHSVLPLPSSALRKGLPFSTCDAPPLSRRPGLSALAPPPSLSPLRGMSKRSRRASDLDGSSSLAEGAPDATVQRPGKYTQLGAPTVQQQIIRCTLPPHEPLGFDAYEDYEVHYHKQHVNRCIACHRNFPTDHFLSLHIAENHDPLTATKRDRGDKTYRCFVEDCDKVCSTWHKRRMHLVDKHMFPKNYDFLIVNHGLDAHASMLRSGPLDHPDKASSLAAHAKAGSNRSCTPPVTPGRIMMDQPDTTEVMETPSAECAATDELAESLASLKFVPKSVAFGRGRQRGGLAKS